MRLVPSRFDRGHRDCGANEHTDDHDYAENGADLADIEAGVDKKRAHHRKIHALRDTANSQQSNDYIRVSAAEKARDRGFDGASVQAGRLCATVAPAARVQE